MVLFEREFVFLCHLDDIINVIKLLTSDCAVIIERIIKDSFFFMRDKDGFCPAEALIVT